MNLSRAASRNTRRSVVSEKEEENERMSFRKQKHDCIPEVRNKLYKGEKIAGKKNWHTDETSPTNNLTSRTE